MVWYLKTHGSILTYATKRAVLHAKRLMGGVVFSKGN